MALLLLAVAFSLFSSTALAQITMFKLSGHTYVDGPWVAGSAVTVIGTLTPPLDGASGFVYPMPVDFDNNEYTFVTSGLTISSFTETDLGVVIHKQTLFDAGELRIYESASMNASYGVFPPNASAPSSFEDGTLLMTASIEDAEMSIFDASGNFQARILFTDQGSLWEDWNAVIAVAESPLSTAPNGYSQDFAGKIEPNFPVVPVRLLTWEGVKTLYR